MSKVLLYGATGYMGKLCAKEFLNHGIAPILAGRSNQVQALAQSLNCPGVSFDLADKAAIVKNLQGVSLVVNLTGPFKRTQKPLVEACLEAHCHYIDIAGEVDEMLAVFAFDRAAQQAGIMLMPGAGFGVVPTDIAASRAKELLPDASNLTILYATEGGVSRGTLKTVLENISKAGVRRVRQELVIAHPAESSKHFTVAGKDFIGVYNPWRADLFTAGLSTNIDNIQTYTVFPGVIVQMMQGKLLWLRDFIVNRLLRFLPEGPSEKQLQQGSTYVMAIAANGTTEKSVAFKGPEAYLFTALCVREVSINILNGHFLPGFQTPSYFGKALLDRLEGIEWD